MPFKRKEKDEPVELQQYVRLLTDHQASLRAFIVSLMPGNPSVGDVLQETNAVLWQKRNRFQHGTNFLAWAFKIARYEVMHQRDRDIRDQRALFSDKMIDVLTEMDPVEESDEEVMTALESCLSKLPSSQRELISARYTAGKSLEQQARQTGRSSSSLRVALHRIRAGLKECIEITLAKRIA